VDLIALSYLPPSLPPTFCQIRIGSGVILTLSHVLLGDFRDDNPTQARGGSRGEGEGRGSQGGGYRRLVRVPYCAFPLAGVCVPMPTRILRPAIRPTSFGASHHDKLIEVWRLFELQRGAFLHGARSCCVARRTALPILGLDLFSRLDLI
jgi:hypothetical protein